MIFVAGVLAVTAATFSWSAERVWQSAAEVYRAACAACHGADGTGMPEQVVGFDVELPDFTDCSFATREPDGDWLAVVHEGGPARGFSEIMPAFGDALGDEEIQMAVDHLRSFCEEDGWPRGDLNLPRPMFTEKAFVEDEAVITLGSTTEKPVEMVAELVFEKRFGSKSQLEVIVPFGVAQLEDHWVGGLGDIALGVKHAWLASTRSGSILSGIGEIILPTGLRRGGIGGGKVVIEPSLAYGQILGPAGFLHLQAGMEIPAEPGATLEAFWRAVYGYTFSQGRFGRSWSPMVEVLGKSDLEQGATVHWDIVPQLQVALNTRQHVLLNVAALVPLEPGKGRPVGVFVYLLWDWFDGGLGEGW